MLEIRVRRVSEGSGEDVFLTSQIAKAYVIGFQEIIFLIIIPYYHVQSILLDMVQLWPEEITTQLIWVIDELRNVCLPPFKATVDSGVEPFMTAFNEAKWRTRQLGDKFILREILRR